MRATLTFDLNDPYDKSAHERALKGTECYLALNDILNDVFRKRIKYGELDFDSENLLVEVRNEIQEILTSYNIDLSNLE